MSVTDDAISRIKQMIQSGELSPGDRLPPEQELSERLGLSRSSMREAVKALATMRVLDVRRGDGTYVTSLRPSLLIETMSFILDYHSDSAVMEVFEARSLLEPGIAVLAAQRASADQIAEMEAHLDKIDETSDTEDLVTHDLEFHRMLAEATGNDYLVGLIEAIGSQTWRARVWRGVTESNAVARTLGEHRQILASIRERDETVARAAMTLHISGAERWISTELDESAD
ncbi:FadR/GntR family transcriptional regulator [Agrococcus casei]|uniref:Transcriptional regulator, GntR family n=1 Tax=Agrococcus casei LMG 22410 TaxID=1255656 RepID=A0A1R4F249_9MICO|nr:FadR/GntR family transcriptional regulator [Agrococcus casei]SJM49903.1 Transcriptional regulator, GntR family [Agrococcus casei LMG 22410]